MNGPHYFNKFPSILLKPPGDWIKCGRIIVLAKFNYNSICTHRKWNEIARKPIFHGMFWSSWTYQTKSTEHKVSNHNSLDVGNTWLKNFKAWYYLLNANSVNYKIANQDNS